MSDINSSTINVEATVEAINLLNASIVERGPLTYTAWKFIDHAKNRLEADLNNYLRGVK